MPCCPGLRIAIEVGVAVRCASRSLRARPSLLGKLTSSARGGGLVSDTHVVAPGETPTCFVLDPGQVAIARAADGDQNAAGLRACSRRIIHRYRSRTVIWCATRSTGDAGSGRAVEILAAQLGLAHRMVPQPRHPLQPAVGRRDHYPCGAPSGEHALRAARRCALRKPADRLDHRPAGLVTIAAARLVPPSLAPRAVERDQAFSWRRPARAARQRTDRSRGPVLHRAPSRGEMRSRSRGRGSTPPSMPIDSRDRVCVPAPRSLTGVLVVSWSSPRADGGDDRDVAVVGLP